MCRFFVQASQKYVKNRPPLRNIYVNSYIIHGEIGKPSHIPS